MHQWNLIIPNASQDLNLGICEFLQAFNQFQEINHHVLWTYEQVTHTSFQSCTETGLNMKQKI
jgi:hypothetical protein